MGCAASDIDKYVANSTDLAKQQTRLIIEDNKEQTETLGKQHMLMAPELAAELKAIQMQYDEANQKRDLKVAAMHHELSKMGEQVGNLMNTALGFLGVGGAGGLGALGYRAGKKKTNA